MVATIKTMINTVVDTQIDTAAVPIIRRVRKIKKGKKTPKEIKKAHSAGDRHLGYGMVNQNDGNIDRW